MTVSFQTVIVFLTVLSQNVSQLRSRYVTIHQEHVHSCKTPYIVMTDYLVFGVYFIIFETHFLLNSGGNFTSFCILLKTQGRRKGTKLLKAVSGCCAGKERVKVWI